MTALITSTTGGAALPLTQEATRLAEESAITGTSGNDRLIGTRNDDSVVATTGTDFIGLRAGADTYASSQALLDLLEAENISRTSLSAITTTGGEAIVDTGSGDDVLATVGRADTLRGGEGDDYLISFNGNAVLEGGLGNDYFLTALHDGLTIRGGEGNDSLDVSLSGSGVNVALSDSGDLSSISASITPALVTSGRRSTERILGVSLALPSTYSMTTNISGIEDIIGSDHNDVLMGSLGNNVLAGGGGRDRIHGIAGNNTLIGGAGHDTFVTGVGSDTVVLDEGTDSVYTSVGQHNIVVTRNSQNSKIYDYNEGAAVVGLQPHSVTLTFQGISFDELTVRTVNNGAIELGLSGGQTLVRLAETGNSIDSLENQYNPPRIPDRLIFDDGRIVSNVRAFFTAREAGQSGEFSDVIATDQIQQLTGNSGDNILRGSDHDNELTGLGGNDRLFGLGGSDTYIIGDDAGIDEIADSDGERDVIRFDTSSPVRFVKAGNDLIALTSSGGAVIRMAGSDQTIEYIEVRSAQAGQFVRLEMASVFEQAEPVIVDDSLIANPVALVEAISGSSSGNLGAPAWLNSTTDGSQQGAQVAMLPAGGHVAVWHDSTGGGQVRGRFFGADGQPRGAAFRVDSSANGNTSSGEPLVAVHADGSFVVAWTDRGSDGLTRVEMQRFDASGATQGSVFNPYGSLRSNQMYPELVTLSNGHIAVATVSDPRYAGTIRIQVVNNTGAFVNSLRAGTFTSFRESSTDPLAAYNRIALTALDNGQFVYAIRNGNTGNTSLNIASPSADRTLHQATLATPSGAGLDLTALEGGGILVAYASGGNIKVQRYSNDLSVVGGESTISLTSATEPRVEALRGGGYFIAWQQSDGLYGQRFRADGIAAGAAIQLTTDSRATEVSISELSDGNLQVAYNTPDASGSGVASRKLQIQILATNTDDILIGAAADDELSGLGGNDQLLGGAGSDTYVIGDNAGIDQIIDTSGSRDTVRFDTRESVRFVKHGNDLIALTRTGGTVIRNVGTGNSIEFIEMRSSQTGRFDRQNVAAVFRQAEVVTVDADVAVNPVTLVEAIRVDTGTLHTPIRLNGNTEGNQDNLEIAMRPGGGYIAVWRDNTGGGQIKGRLFDADGSPVADEFRIDSNENSNTSSGLPRLAVHSDGSFAVVWTDRVSRGASTVTEVEMRRYDASGRSISGVTAPLGALQHQDGRDRTSPDIVALADGGYALSVVSHSQSFYTHILDNTGSVTYTGIQSSSLEPSAGHTVASALLSNGNYVQVSQEGNSGQIKLQVNRANGRSAGRRVTVDLAGGGRAAGVSVSALEGGGFVVAYASSGNLVIGRYNNDGSTNGSVTVLNLNSASRPEIEALTGGGYFATWHESGGVFGQRFQADGTASGSEIMITGDTSATAVAITELTDGSLQLGFTSASDGDGTGVVTRKLVFSSAEVEAETSEASDVPEPSAPETSSGVIEGTAGDDTLRGTAEDDVINGGTGSNTLTGADGDDLLTATIRAGSESVNVIHGGRGEDTARFDTTEGLMINLGTDSFSHNLDVMEVENIIGGSGADFIHGDSNDNTLSGRDGNDGLWGEGGDDTLIGGSGRDYLDGGEGTDTVSYEYSATGVTVDLDTRVAPDGDTFNSIENLRGSAFADTLSGDSNSNRLEGGAGNDILNGQRGNDVLVGGDGTDTLNAGEGSDVLVVSGDDTATATDGYDAFVLEADTRNATLNVSGTGNVLDLRNMAGSVSVLPLSSPANSYRVQLTTDGADTPLTVATVSLTGSSTLADALDRVILAGGSINQTQLRTLQTQTAQGSAWNLTGALPVPEAPAAEMAVAESPSPVPEAPAAAPAETTTPAPAQTVTTRSVVTSTIFGQGLGDGWTTVNQLETQANGGTLGGSRSGTRIAKLDSTTDGAPDAYSYSVDTSGGNAHEVTLWVKQQGNLEGSDGIEVLWNNQLLQTIDPSTSWREVSITLPDTDQARTQLMIREVAGQSNGAGPLIDQITVSKVVTETPDALRRSLVEDVTVALDFNEGAGVRAEDSTSGHHDAILSGTASWGAGHRGESALEFHGTRGLAEFSQVETGGAMTISAWVKLDDLTGRWSHIVDFGNGPMNNNITLAHRGSTNSLTFQIHTDNDFGSVEVNNFFAEGEWAHVTATVDEAGRMALYKNGELAGETVNGAVPTEMERTNHYIGGSTWGDGYLDGSVDELVVVDRALDAEAVRVLHQVDSVDTLMSAAPFDPTRSLAQLTQAAASFMGEGSDGVPGAILESSQQQQPPGISFPLL